MLSTWSRSRSYAWWGDTNDTNAVDICTAGPRRYTAKGELFGLQHLLEYGRIVPASHTLEGLYIDGHLVLQIWPSRRDRKDMRFPDEGIVAPLRQQYVDLHCLFRLRKGSHTSTILLHALRFPACPAGWDVLLPS